jgi:hypothetical protein
MAKGESGMNTGACSGRRSCVNFQVELGASPVGDNPNQHAAHGDQGSALWRWTMGAIFITIFDNLIGDSTATFPFSGHIPRVAYQ